MEWFRKLVGQVKNLWGQWKPVQKVVFLSIVGVVVVGIVLLVAFSAQPSRVELFSRPITDPEDLDRIGIRLDEEGIPYTVTSDARILVEDQAAARRARSILVREDLVPPDTDPWQLFDVERWTQTDFERNVNLRRALTRSSRCTSRRSTTWTTRASRLPFRRIGSFSRSRTRSPRA